MAQDVIEAVGKLTEGFNQIQKNWDDSAKEMKEKGEKSGEQIQKNTEMALDLTKQIKDLTNAFARKAEVSENGAKEAKSLDEFNAILKSHKRGKIERDEFTSTKSAFDKMVRKGIDSLSPDERKSLNTVIDPNGGYFFTPEYGMMDKAKKYDAQGLINMVDRVSVTQSTYDDIIDWSDYDKAYYQEELEENDSTQDGEDFKNFVLDVKAQKYGKKFSRTFLEDDSRDVQGKIMMRLTKGMERKKAKLVSDAFLAVAEGSVYGKIESAESATVGSIGWDDVFDGVRTKLKDGYKENASYGMNDSTFAKLLISKDSNERYQVGNQINFFSGDRMSLSILGNPVVFDSGLPDVAGGAYSVLYGDFAEAGVMAERSGNSIIRDETHPDYVKLWLRNRHNFGIINFEAVKRLKIKA